MTTTAYKKCILNATLIGCDNVKYSYDYCLAVIIQMDFRNCLNIPLYTKNYNRLSRSFTSQVISIVILSVSLISGDGFTSYSDDVFYVKA